MQVFSSNLLFRLSIFIALFFSFSCSDRSVSPTFDEEQSTDNGFDPDVVTDIDGNVYPTKRIGSQLWLAENLRVTHYRNGDPISEVSEHKDWARLTSGAYCIYENDSGNVDLYGLLYNWHAVNDSRILAPAGWHIPTDREWQTLIDFLGGSSFAGDAMKDSIGWIENGNGSNISKFTALPGGVRYSNGLFDGIRFTTSFWSSTNVSTDGAWGRWLSYLSPAIGLDDASQLDGFSVRCVKD
jgi:uncharacterized protein (TIGR02145 family)